jgi:hypothetical protein
MATLHLGPPGIGFSVNKPKNTLSTGVPVAPPGYALLTRVIDGVTYYLTRVINGTTYYLMREI